MNKHIRLAAWAVAASASVGAPAHGAANSQTVALSGMSKSCKSVQVAPDSQRITLGKARVIQLNAPVSKIMASGPFAGDPGKSAASAPPSVAPRAAADQPSVADIDVLLLSPTDLFVRGTKAGVTNIILRDVNDVCYLNDIVVSVDPAALQAKLAELMPDEKGIVVKSAGDVIVLTGTVSGAGTLDEALRVAGGYGDSKHLVNLMRVTAPQQVMLEVKIAEVSKTLLDKFGIDVARMFTSADGLTSKVMSGIFGGAPALFGRFANNARGAAVAGAAEAVASSTSAAARATLSTTSAGATLLGVDAQNKDGLVRILAEPNIMAISGQSASFLSGGKIFIPVAQTNNGGAPTITLQEKEFGVGLKFSPTVLDSTRVNLKLVSEVSELSQTGSPFTTVGDVTAVLPSLTTRQVDTTVQLNDGQSFAVAGLIRNSVTQTLSRFPGLGDIPVLGALFRSTEFQKDQTELIFIVTPRLVKPAGGLAAPTDNHAESGAARTLLLGKEEGRATARQEPTDKQ
ncbi:MAG: type II and III secretion system protein family protein [Telluria sp.]